MPILKRYFLWQKKELFNMHLKYSKKKVYSKVEYTEFLNKAQSYRKSRRNISINVNIDHDCQRWYKLKTENNLYGIFFSMSLCILKLNHGSIHACIIIWGKNAILKQVKGTEPRKVLNVDLMVLEILQPK